MSSSTFFNGCKVFAATLLLVSQGSAYTFQPVTGSCIYWDFLSENTNDDPYKLHCIQDQDSYSGIVNTKWKFVEAGFCPYYDRHAQEINIRPCDSGFGRCPTKTIFSYEALQYAGCYSSFKRSKTMMTSEPILPKTEQPMYECRCTEGIIGIIAIASTSFFHCGSFDINSKIVQAINKKREVT